MKAVLESMKSIKTELSTIKEGQAEVVEAVVKRLDRVEDVQQKQEAQLVMHEAAIKKSTKKAEEGDRRIKSMEEQVGKISRDMSDEVMRMRQTNAVVKEIREIERCGKNLIFGNIPEPSGETAEDQKREDEGRLSEIFKELDMDQISPAEVQRVGRKAQYPRKVKVIFRNLEEREKVLESGQNVKLANDVFITHDRTYNQRQEARLYREEKEKEERTSGEASAVVTAPRKPRGRPRGSGAGSVVGKGSRSTNAPKQKKRPSSRSAERESSRQRTDKNLPSQNGNDEQEVLQNTQAEALRTPDSASLRQVSDRPSKPRPRAANVSLTPATASENF
jgi:hypothetical protein